ncbi:MAG TPA: L-histidine N(alpha)-methyltransferase [Planctomycetota bacterium]|nr:L-histidine N(alpha)-methyltransferase [Planctomycetota bacterium]
MTASPDPNESPSPDDHHRPVLVAGAPPVAADTARLLRAALAAPQPSIPPKFFYDDLGSRLFSAITALDEYYPTRTEQALLAEHLPAIVAAAPVAGCTFIDLGAGNCEKAARLLGTVRPARYVAVDISTDFLASSLESMQRRFPDVEMLGVGTDFSDRLELPPSVPRHRPLFFYPGSSIGNFAPARAAVFLAQLGAQMHRGGVLWIGVDLRKARDVLERAYDDELGVTAAFNRNVLCHVNRLAGTDFVLADWRHVAFYDEGHGRIEMHLEAVREVTVQWPGGRRTFRRGDRLHTENSYKYDIEGFTELLAKAGLRRLGCWTDAARWFGFFVAVPAEEP